MAGNVPGILPKTALVGSRAIYYPFALPQKVVTSATNVGTALDGAANGIVNSVGQAYASLEPKGPAKWLLPVLEKMSAATVRSREIANRNNTVFWEPMTQGLEGVGRALAGPGAYWYLKKAGMEEPTADAIKGVLNMKLFDFPVLGGPGGGDPGGGDPGGAGGAGDPGGAGGAGAPADEAGTSSAPPSDGNGSPTPPPDEAPAPNGNPGPVPPEAAEQPTA